MKTKIFFSRTSKKNPLPCPATSNSSSVDEEDVFFTFLKNNPPSLPLPNLSSSGGGNSAPLEVASGVGDGGASAGSNPSQADEPNSSAGGGVEGGVVSVVNTPPRSTPSSTSTSISTTREEGHEDLLFHPSQKISSLSLWSHKHNNNNNIAINGQCGGGQLFVDLPLLWGGERGGVRRGGAGSSSPLIGGGRLGGGGGGGGGRVGGGGGVRIGSVGRVGSVGRIVGGGVGGGVGGRGGNSSAGSGEGVDLSLTILVNAPSSTTLNTTTTSANSINSTFIEGGGGGGVSATPLAAAGGFVPMVVDSGGGGGGGGGGSGLWWLRWTSPFGRWWGGRGWKLGWKWRRRCFFSLFSKKNPPAPAATPLVDGGGNWAGNGEEDVFFYFSQKKTLRLRLAHLIYQRW